MRGLLINRLFWIAGAILGTVLTLIAIETDLVDFSDASSRERLAQPDARGSVPWLMEKHDCWQDEAPPDMEGELPGHVVLTYPGAVAPTYGGARAVGVALEHLFGEEKRPGLVVHGFCR